MVTAVPARDETAGAKPAKQYGVTEPISVNAAGPKDLELTAALQEALDRSPPAQGRVQIDAVQCQTLEPPDLRGRPRRPARGLLKICKL